MFDGYFCTDPPHFKAFVWSDPDITARGLEIAVSQADLITLLELFYCFPKRGYT
jgi:hypothetical protein